MDYLTVAALILNAVSVCATHCLLGEDHTHWAHRPWWIKLNQRHDYVEGALLITYRYPWLNFFHFFSALRWPLLVVVVYQMPKIWWIVVPVALQAVWWVVKKSFRKEWKSIKSPF